MFFPSYHFSFPADLGRQIFSYVDKTSLLNATLVSKAWFDYLEIQIFKTGCKENPKIETSWKKHYYNLVQLKGFEKQHSSQKGLSNSLVLPKKELFIDQNKGFGCFFYSRSGKSSSVFQIWNLHKDQFYKEITTLQSEKIQDCIVGFPYLLATGDKNIYVSDISGKSTEPLFKQERNQMEEEFSINQYGVVFRQNKQKIVFARILKNQLQICFEENCDPSPIALLHERMLIYTKTSCCIVIRKVEEQAILHLKELITEHPVRAMKVNGSILVTQGQDLLIWNLVTYQAMRIFQGIQAKLSALTGYALLVQEEILSKRVIKVLDLSSETKEAKELCRWEDEKTESKRSIGAYINKIYILHCEKKSYNILLDPDFSEETESTRFSVYDFSNK